LQTLARQALQGFFPKSSQYLSQQEVQRFILLLEHQCPVELSQTNVFVSCLGLGTLRFGTLNSYEESTELLDLYLEAGGRFLDTANCYNQWAANAKGGESEVVLGRWLREDVTYHTCYDRKADLIAQVDRFQARIKADPIALADRLWVKSHLDPKEEKLRVST
jgi:diketogulonate reductase-like aldo/keto reductase